MAIDRRNLPVAQAVMTDQSGRATPPFYDFLRRIVDQMVDFQRQLDELRALIEELTNQEPIDLSQYTRRAANEPITGQWDFFAPVRGPFGTAELPGFTFTDDEDTGLFHVADDNLGISTAGVQRWDVNTERTFQSLPLQVQVPVLPAGTFHEAMTLYSSTTVGGLQVLFQDGAPTGDDIEVALGFWSNGTPSTFPPFAVGRGFRFDAIGHGANPMDFVFKAHDNSSVGSPIYSAVSNRAQLVFVAGSEAVPSAAFGDDDTGIYGPAANTVGISTNGTLKLSIGVTAVTAVVPVRIPDGSNGTPGLAFATDTNTGIFRGGENILEIATGAATRLSISAATITASLPLLGTGGTEGAPGFSFSGNTGTGMYSGTVGTLRLAAGSVQVLGATSTSFNPTVSVRNIDGSAGTPSYSFGADQNTGIYRIGADQLGITTGGTVRWDISTTRISQNVPLHLPDGVVGTPAYSFGADTDTGLYRIGADNIGISTGGTLCWDVDTTDIVFTLPQRGAAGSSGTPTYSFSADPNTGTFNQAADVFGIAANGAEVARFDADATAGNTRFMIYDVDNGALERVSVGDPDSGGLGFKVLRIPN